MKADLTRLTFDPAKHYRGVHQQQGRVQLDSDWNEQAALVSHRIETETLDVIGHCGAPLHDDGFRLVSGFAELTPAEAARPGNAPLNPAPGASELLLTAGRFYAGGVLVVNERLVRVAAQPELPSSAELTASGLPAPLLPTAAGSYLAYLDVWPRHRTALEDSSLREIALGGPDTATRTKNSWQVKFLSVPNGSTCATTLPAWDALTKPALGTLSAEALQAPSTNSPCIVEPGSGYRRLENQLYRVEVHQGGATLAQTTFKWSRDNGSVVARWVGKQAGSLDLQVENTGRDKVLGLDANQWVELTDDTREELGQPGLFVQIDTVEGDIVRLRAPHLAASEIAKFPRHPKLRRWEGRPGAAGQWIDPEGNAKALSTAAGAPGLFELEDGVAVRFGAGSFRTGDYWLIPARTARPQIDWPAVPGTTTPAKLPPHGVPHHFCKLAVVTVPSTGGAPTVADCRPLFPPLTELTSLFYVGGDAQSATPNPALPATVQLPPLPLPLEVGVANGEHPVAGARIRFTVTSGGGALSAVGLGADGTLLTGPDGVARVNWALRNSDPAGAQAAGHRVTAELIDPAATRVHLPVVFHATLLTAAKVAYDPAKCDDMKAVPVVTVQDALDFLCARKDDAAECCLTVGERDGRPGDFPSLKEAFAALASAVKKSSVPAVCLSLLPGEHRLEQALTLQLDKSTVFKLDGCNHAARLVLSAPFHLIHFSSVVIRDLGIEIEEEGHLRFEECSLVTLANNLVRGHSTALSLLSFASIGRLHAFNNIIQARPTQSAELAAFLPATPEIKRYFATATYSESKALVAEITETYTALPLAKRVETAALITKKVEAAKSILPSGEINSYLDLAETIADPARGALEEKLEKIRRLETERRALDYLNIKFDRDEGEITATVPPTATPPSTPPVSTVPPPSTTPATPTPKKPAAQPLAVALLLEDFAANVTLSENHITGQLRYLDDGLGKGPLAPSDLKRLDGLIRKKALQLTAARGFLRLRGNTIGRVAWGDAFADELREATAAGDGSIRLWAGAQLTDNRFLETENFLAARILTLSGNQFAGGEDPSGGILLAARGVLSGNISDDITFFHNFIIERSGAANLALDLQPPL
jgi:hypothetical protein